MSTIHHLDANGLLCPEPLMLLRQKIRQIDVGDIVEVTATDPSTERDFRKFCTFQQHELLEQREESEQFIFRIKKC